MSNVHNNIHTEAKRLFMRNKHKDAISLIRKHKAKKSISNVTVDLDLAFALYHDALKDYWNKKIGAKRKIEVNNELMEAIEICLEIIKKIKLENTDNIDLINARIFLAQIYASLGNKDAIILGLENYKNQKNALTANRMMDIYRRLGNIPSAIKWLKKYQNLAQIEGISRYEINTNVSIFYFSIGKPLIAEKIAKETMKLLPRSSKGMSLKKILDHVIKK